jgi:hypothetical protein
LQENGAQFDHSDISHNSAESYLESENKITSTGPIITEKPDKIKYSKPIFKLKTTTAPPATDKYVLVHTISNSQETNKIEEETTRKPTTSDSIQSIILMLNGTSHGPEYEVSGAGGNYYTPDSTPAYSNFQSTASMENKYSPFITTGVPHRPTTLNVPSTSYIYSPFPVTRRPATKKPEKITTLNVPHTSYVYSPNPTKRPTIGSSSVQPNKKFTTIPTKTTTIKTGVTDKVHLQPTYGGEPVKVDDNFVILTGGDMTKHPSPTVHITPKPVKNVNNKVTQSIQTKFPFTVTTVTERPIYSSTNNYAPSTAYGPHIQDFQDEGYFGGIGQSSTVRPILEHTVTSTSYYTVVDNNLYQSLSTIRPHQPPGSQPIVVNKIQLPGGSGQLPPLKDQAGMTTDAMNNFPPVRNPYLNMTGGTMPVMDPEEIATPTFVEDEALNEKMNLLVNKIVASLQGNFDNLVDIVYERKNVSTAEHDISNLNKDEVKVTTKKPTVTKVTKPTKTPIKATQKPVKATQKPPKATTKPPARPVATTKKPVRAPATTKKPATKRTTPRPQGKLLIHI